MQNISVGPDPLNVLSADPDWTVQAIWSFIFSLFSAAGTLLIPIVLLVYQRHSDQKKQDTERRQERLLGHTEAIANNPAMSIIDDFRRRCKSDVFDSNNNTGTAHYGAVFRELRAQRTRASCDGVQCMSRKELAEVDAARRQLQGIWDAVLYDFKEGRLPRGVSIKTAKQGLLRRGVNYMLLVEPLEVARWHMMKAQQQVSKDYFLWQPVDEVNLENFTFSKARAARFKWLEEAYTRKLLHEVHRDTNGQCGRLDPELETPQQQHWWGRLLARMWPKPIAVGQPSDLNALYADLEKCSVRARSTCGASVIACRDWLQQLKQHRRELVRAAHESAPEVAP